MSFTESIAAGRAFARHDDPRPVPNRELIALGAANLAGSFFHSFPAGGGTSQTAVNSRAGARTQVSELVTVAIVVATLFFLSPLISLLPQATLAAVVVVTTLPLLSPADFRSILRIRRTEFRWALAACVGVVLLGTLQGILVAIAISVLTLFYQANHPAVYAVGRKPGTEVFRPLIRGAPGGRDDPGSPDRQDRRPDDLRQRTSGRRAAVGAGRRGGSAGRDPGVQRHPRLRVHGAAGLDRGRGETAGARGSRCGCRR